MERVYHTISVKRNNNTVELRPERRLAAVPMGIDVFGPSRLRRMG